MSYVIMGNLPSLLFTSLLLTHLAHADKIVEPSGSPPLPIPRPNYTPPPANVTFQAWPYDQKHDYCSAEKVAYSQKTGDGPTELSADCINEALKEAGSKGLEIGDLKDLAATFARNADRIVNRRYVTIAKLSDDKNSHRFFVIDTTTGHVEDYKVSHGHNSDKDKDGKVEDQDFSNADNSHRSSCGYLMTGDTYQSGKYKIYRTNKPGATCLHMHGVEAGKNDKVCGRDIMTHPKVDAGEADTWGCLGIPPEASDHIIDEIKGWSMVYVPCINNTK